MTSILRLRPSLRPPPNPSSLFLRLPSTYRTFHASPRPQFLELAPVLTPIFTTGLSCSHELLCFIHNSTGLPWVAVLPLSALMMRLTILLPVSIYTRKRQQKAAELNPLLYAWQHQARRSIMKEDRGATPGYVEKEAAKDLRMKRRELYRRWGVQRWKTFLPPVFQMPVWLTLVETIRRMCGAREGLLGMMLPDVVKTTAAKAAAAAGIQESSTTLVQGSDMTNEILSDAVKTGMGHPEFATEGMLWFPNLLLPDPIIFPLPIPLSPLPILVSCSLLCNIGRGGKGMNKGWQSRIHGTLMILGIAVAPLTVGMPAAVHVYWISSATFGFIQNTLLDRYMPVKEPVKPVKPVGKHTQTPQPPK